MQNIPQASFIPKQGAVTPKQQPQRKRGGINGLNVTALIVFIGVLLLAGGVFFYELQLKKTLEAKRVELTEIKKTFSQSDIARIKEFDERTRTALSLVEKHLAPSKIFGMFEARTIKEIQFSNFSYNASENSVTVDVSGNAPRFNSVARQEEEFAATPFLIGSILSGLSVSESKAEDADGNRVPGETDILFNVTGLVETSEIAYKVPGTPATQPSSSDNSTSSGSTESSSTTNTPPASSNINTSQPTSVTATDEEESTEPKTAGESAELGENVDALLDDVFNDF